MRAGEGGCRGWCRSGGAWGPGPASSSSNHLRVGAPARGPRPASSTPATRANPCRHRSCSYCLDGPAAAAATGAAAARGAAALPRAPAPRLAAAGAALSAGAWATSAIAVALRCRLRGCSASATPASPCAAAAAGFRRALAAEWVCRRRAAGATAAALIAQRCGAAGPRRRHRNRAAMAAADGDALRAGAWTLNPSSAGTAIVPGPPALGLDSRHGGVACLKAAGARRARCGGKMNALGNSTGKLWAVYSPLLETLLWSHADRRQDGSWAGSPSVGGQRDASQMGQLAAAAHGGYLSPGRLVALCLATLPGTSRARLWGEVLRPTHRKWPLESVSALGKRDGSSGGVAGAAALLSRWLTGWLAGAPSKGPSKGDSWP